MIFQLKTSTSTEEVDMRPARQNCKTQFSRLLEPPTLANIPESIHSREIRQYI